MVFSIDRSASIKSASLKNIVDMVKGVIALMNVDNGKGPNVGSYRVGVQSFNTEQDVHKHLSVPGGAFGDIPEPTGGTDIGTAVK